MKNQNIFRWQSVLALVLILRALVGFPLADYRKVGGGLNFFSERDDYAMGLRYSQELNRKLDLVGDPYINNYVTQLGQRLAQSSLRPVECQFFVVNTSEVNAFALPGGFIYINRGLIDAADSECELAGVLGHEIGHVIGRHATHEMSKKLLLLGIVVGTGVAVSQKSHKWGQAVVGLGGVGVFFASLKFSRDAERQADWLGFEAMVRAGYDPRGLVTFFQRLDRMGTSRGGPGLAFINTHPLPAERVENMEQEIQQLTTHPPSPIVSTPAFAACKERFAGLPLPPRGRERTLGDALASLEPAETPGGSGGLTPDTTLPANTGQAVALTLDVPGTTVWLDTGVDLIAGQEVEIAARGQLYWKKNSNGWCTPDGAPGSGRSFWKPIPSANTGALIARVGTGYGNYILIGQHQLFRSPLTGRLYLGINDDNKFDNRGGYQVAIRTAGY